MVDVRLVAVVLGFLPFLAVLLYVLERTLAGRRDVAWGVLAGLVAFLGIGHAMADLLFSEPFLAEVGGGVLSLFVLVTGLLFGMRTSWQIVVRPERWRWSAPTALVWGAAVYFALHSLGDGLALGGAFVGPSPFVEVDALTMTATIVHRFAEGGLVVLPALAAGWSVRKSLGPLFLGLLVIPGAALMAVIGGPLSLEGLGVRAFVGGAEAGFALVLLLGAILPQAAASHRARWIAWAGAAFLVIALVHGIVE
jgi:hypothetical protein